MDIKEFREYQANLKNKPKRPKFGFQTKACSFCNKEYVRNNKFSNFQWSQSKFCSSRCLGESRKKNDGMKNRDERYRRKMGCLKQGTPEWLERIRATTKEGMYKPEVQEKIRRPKGPMSEAGKIVRSDALVGQMPKNTVNSYNNAYAHVQRGTYICSKGDVFFRSKWEANYALFLDFLVKQKEILSWEYEAERFFFEKIKLGTRTYTPDFKIINPDKTAEYHEIKGRMDARSKAKLRRMETYFPDIKLVLIERKSYSDILKKLKGVIKFY